MPKKFILRSNQMIGAASAESDSDFLTHCYIDTGDLDILKSTKDPRNILVGRTGAGKSALLIRLIEDEEHVISISPESLSLSFIANSNVIQFFSNAGVNMDIFYRLLWRHIFCVEVLKERFGIDDEDKKRSFIDRLWSLVPKNKQHQRALDYLRKWGESFWEETEYRIKEVTSTFERELESSVEGKIPSFVSLIGLAGQKITDEEKAVIVHRGQEVVNRVQIRELTDVIKLIDEVLLSDRQQKYYIVIDRLDEPWVEDNVRFRLIRALIVTSVEMSRIDNLKVNIAIRSDLLDRVYRYTRDMGFQEEKYSTSALEISWNRRQLIDVLNSRINYLVKDQYTTEIVTYKDLLPEKIGKQETIEYLLDRTLMRPRDIIQFFNACIKYSDGKPNISVSALREAEGYYSRYRLHALFDEWQSLYPNLPSLFNLLKGKDAVFSILDITTNDIENNALQICISKDSKPGLDLELILQAINGDISYDEYRKEILFIFFRIGLVGLKVEKNTKYSWSHLSGLSVSSSEITERTKVQVHKTFWRVLGVYEPSE
jgi:hypothetical protein